MAEPTLALIIIAGLLMILATIIITNGLQRRKAIKVAEFLKYALTIIVIGAVIITIINHLINLKLWQILN